MMVADCAPFVALSTLGAIMQQESGGDPFAVHVNGIGQQPMRPRSKREAVATAERYLAEGYSVDLGRMQVNSRNLPVHGVTVAQMLESHSCDNIRVAADILGEDYKQAAALYGEGQRALWAALSAYNTGSFYRGASYVARYVGPTVPAIERRGAGHGETFNNAPASPYSADTVQVPNEWEEMSHE